MAQQSMVFSLIRPGDIIYSRSSRGYAYCLIIAVFEEFGSFTMLRHDDAVYGGNPTTIMILSTPVNKTLLTREGWELAGWKFADR